MTSPRSVDQWWAATSDGRRVPAKYLRAVVDTPEPEPAPALSPILPYYYLCSAQYSADRPIACLLVPRHRRPPIFHTDFEREKSPVNANGLREHILQFQWCTTTTYVSSSENNYRQTTNASNVRRFASQFACTSGEP